MVDLVRAILASPCAERLYGDERPHWTQGKEKSRHCKSAREAEADRDLLVSRLRRPSVRNKEYEKLAKTLADCRPERRCLSGACPTCTRALQRWFVIEVDSLIKTDHRPYSALSIVPREGRFGLSNAEDDIFQSIRTALEDAFDLAGITVVVGGFDPGVNEHDRGTFQPYGQIQLWAFAPQDEVQGNKNAIRRMFPAKGHNRRPVRITDLFSGDLNGIAYAVKSDFVRRVSLPRKRRRDGTTGQRRNTRNRALRIAQQCQLALALDRAGLDARLFLRGVLIRTDHNGHHTELSTSARAAHPLAAETRSRAPPFIR